MLNTAAKILEQSYEKYPDKTSFTDKDRSITYRELHDLSVELSKKLITSSKNKPVVVLIPKSVKNIISFYASLYAGHFYVPVDYRNPSQRLQKILSDIQPSAIIIDRATEKTISSLEFDNKISIVNIDDFLEAPRKIESVDWGILNSMSDCDPVYCIYTSGSTGTPKGVMIQHRSILNYVNFLIEEFKLESNCIFANQSQFHFDISSIDIFANVLIGGTCHIVPEELFSFPQKLVEFLNERQVNSLYWVPAAMNFVASTDAFSVVPPKTLKNILFAGEAMPNKTLNYWRRHNPLAKFVNLYGPTEITVTCTHYEVNRSFSDSDPLPIGKPSYNCDVFLLNTNNELIPVNNTNDVGEICVRSSSLSVGYWNDIEKTNKVFIQNPLNPHYPEKIYLTGDLAKYNEFGEIMYLGRKDHQIKHMGYRIELGEIERVISGIQSISNVCSLYDKEGFKIVCFFETTDSGLNSSKLYAELLKLLPKYMMPGVLIQLPSFPINHSGKIDRTLLDHNYRNGIYK